MLILTGITALRVTSHCVKICPPEQSPHCYPPIQPRISGEHHRIIEREFKCSITFRKVEFMFCWKVIEKNVFFGGGL